MAAEVIYGTFDESRAVQIIDRLHEEGVSDKSINIVGAERNQMLPMTSQIVDRKRMHPFVAKTIVGGVILGFIAGLATFFIPTISAESVVGPLIAAVCGACAGAYIGLLGGAAVAFDNPVWVARVYEGPVPSHKVKIGVQTDSEHDRQIQHLLEQAGAEEIDIRRAA